MKRVATELPNPHRRGTIAPVAAVALLALLAALALVLDRMWLEAARKELQIAAEAAALAGARELADDELLRVSPDGARLAAQSARSAEAAADQNTAVGQAVVLDASAGDVRVGRRVWDEGAGELRLLETPAGATAVEVTARRERSRLNPVAMLIQLPGSVDAADVRVRVEAEADRHVVGVRPLPGTRVPGIPLAILANDPSGQTKETWDTAIEQRQGQDNYGFDAAKGAVVRQSDGIPEIELTTIDPADPQRPANVFVVELGTGLSDARVAEQIEQGWSERDFEVVDGELRLPARPVTLSGRATIADRERQALSDLHGECRAVLLYENAVAGAGAAGSMGGRIRIVRLVAGRVMTAERRATGMVRVVFQPGVLITRSAVLESELGESAGVPGEPETTNRYVYKVKLTR